MALKIERANLSDVDELLSLYLTIYGRDYPLRLGSNKGAMSAAIENQSEFLWLVMRDEENGFIAGSAIFEMDLDYRIGKVAGVVVNTSYQRKGIAKKLISYGSDKVLNEDKLVNSLYATSRTLCQASQLMFLHNGYLPMGIFPNARKIKTYETLALLGRFSDGVLDKRVQISRLPETLSKIYKINDSILKLDTNIREIIPYSENRNEQIDNSSRDGEFEFIFAPSFVQKRFDEIIIDDKETRFFPFHKANLLVSCDESELEVYANFNKKDHYCVLMAANQEITSIGEKFEKMLFSMKDIGIYYVEVLVRCDHSSVIDFFRQNRFLPAALYPAMREENGKMFDYVLMTRTMVPLDFSEISIDESFRPYVNQYAKQWVHMNLRTIEDQGALQ